MTSSERRRRSARRACPRRWRLAWSTASSVLVLLAVVGCGGGGDRGTAPELSRDVGRGLAAQTAEVEEALAAGDADRARREANELVAAVREAIDRGEVPAPLADELLPAAEHLASLVPDPQAPPAAPPPSAPPSPAPAPTPPPPAPPPPTSPAPTPPPPPATTPTDDEDEADEGEEQEDGDDTAPGNSDNGKGKGKGRGKGNG